MDKLAFATPICLVLLLLFITGCSFTKKTILFTTNCKGNELSFKKLEENNIDAQAVNLEMEFDKHASIVFDAATTLPLNKGNTMPYEKGLFDNVDWQLIDTVTHYGQTQDKQYEIGKIYLFINPKKISKTQYESLAQCLKENKEAIVEMLGKEIRLSGNQIAVLVYGELKNFEQRFTKTSKDYIIIYPNGSIVQFFSDSNSNTVSSQLIMPQKKIIIWNTDNDINNKDIFLYKNEQGIPITHFFKVEMRPGAIKFMKATDDYLTIINDSYLSLDFMKNNSLLKGVYLDKGEFLPVADTSAATKKALSEYKNAKGVPITKAYPMKLVK